MRQHYNMLYDYGLKLTNGDEDTTKDCIQETFLAYWNHAADWAAIQSVKAYLLVTFRNRIIDHQRQQNRFVPTVFWAGSNEMALQPDFVFSPEDFLIQEATRTERSNLLANALNGLTRRQREAVFLRFFQEMDYADMAQVMGVRERTVYNLVHEGLNALRQQLPPAWLLRLAGGLLASVFIQ
ncbi:sigma-70 family RNA polymerase sigma factor [Fibrisoma montanum]|uniref:Sigma-70 family RNA polymerase sigma factor n=2 Tax=Fibrisoma montanum TaxID=2305895 RepID=A0A418MAW9_9BACT|nr:sigma-70 family RNA polymerase sigma factor [Fibrisoma montanum]